MCLYDSSMFLLSHCSQKQQVKNYETGNKKTVFWEDILLYEYLEPLDYSNQ